MTNTWKETVQKERNFSDLWNLKNLQKWQYIMGDHTRIKQLTFWRPRNRERNRMCGGQETECGQGKNVLPQSDEYPGCQYNCIWNQQKHKPCTSLRGFLIIIFKADTFYIWATSSVTSQIKVHRKKKFCLLPPCPHAYCQVHLLCCWGIIHSLVWEHTTSSGFPYTLKVRSSLGILQHSSTRLDCWDIQSPGFKGC